MGREPVSERNTIAQKTPSTGSSLVGPSGQPRPADAPWANVGEPWSSDRRSPFPRTTIVSTSPLIPLLHVGTAACPQKRKAIDTLIASVPTWMLP